MRGMFFKGVVLGSVSAALVLSATAALAGTGVGGIFNLGKSNTVNATSGLSGATAGTQLRVANTSTASGAVGLGATNASHTAAAVLATNGGGGPALQANVKSNAVPPLRVNSKAQVANLNASLLGGHAAAYFLPATATAANSSKLGGQLPSHYLSTTGTAANSSKLGGQLPSYYLAASVVRRIGPTTVTGCNPSVTTCSSATLVTIGQLTIQESCINDDVPMGEQDAFLYVKSSAAHGSYADLTSLNSFNAQPDMAAGTSYTLGGVSTGSLGAPQVGALNGEALSADGHELSYDLYAAQNVGGTTDGHCVFGGTIVVK